MRDLSSHPFPVTTGAEAIRTLLVDDRAVFLHGLLRFLANQKTISVAGIARDGVEALEQAAALRPELVLMDLDMPRMNGIEAARLLRASMPGIRIVIASANDEPGVASACCENGADAFVSKADVAHALMPLLTQLFADSAEKNARVAA